MVKLLHERLHRSGEDSPSGLWLMRSGKHLVSLPQGGSVDHQLCAVPCFSQYARVLPRCGRGGVAMELGPGRLAAAARTSSDGEWARVFGRLGRRTVTAGGRKRSVYAGLRGKTAT